MNVVPCLVWERRFGENPGMSTESSGQNASRLHYWTLLVVASIGIGCSQSSENGTGARARARLAGERSADRVRVVILPGNGSVPDAELDADGVVHVAYIADNDVYYVRSTDGGDSFEPAIRVNSEAGFALGGAFRGPDLAIGRDQRVHIVWYNLGYQQQRPPAEWGVNYARLDKESGLFEPTRNLNQRPSDNFSVAADGNGHVTVVWMADGIFTTTSTDGGNSFDPAIDLAADPCECCSSRAIYANDALSVLYRSKTNNERDMFLAQPGRDAEEFSHAKVSQSVWEIESCPMTGSFLSATSKGLVASWETQGRIYFTRLNTDGTLQSQGEVLVSEIGRYPVALTAPDQTSLVAWKNGTVLEWRLFDATDQPVGTVDSHQAANPDRPAGIVTKDGSFLLFP
jgi:hypothetical protein